MADANGGMGTGEGAPGEARLAGHEKASRGVRMLERLIAGSSLAEVAADEGLTPRRAREVVAERGFDP